MLDLIKVALEDIQQVFEIKENLYEKYIEGEILKDDLLKSLVARREDNFDWKKETPLGGAGTTLNACVLYCLIKHYNMIDVIETGVSGGYYTCFILSALRENNKTSRGQMLCSLELSDDMNEVGKLVPASLREVTDEGVDWNLIAGKSSLETFKEWKVQGLQHAAQLYSHDSLHTLSHMLRELHEFKQSISDRFVVFIDDEKADSFWDKAVAMKAFDKQGYKVTYISGKESRLSGHLGGFIKYERI